MAVNEENKVQFNLKNVHYAKVLTETPAVTWDTPVAVPGAVSIAISPVGEIKKFFADGIVYWQGSNNGGYEGDLELARIPEKMFQDIWGMALDDTDKVLIENANDRTSNFALLFQIDGDKNDQLYLFYNCTATRPGIDAKTNEEAKEPQPQKLSVSCAALADGRIKAGTTAETTQPVRAAWFTKVYEKGGV